MRLIPLFFVWLAPVLNAAEINALSIESEPGQPFLAQSKIHHAQSNTDLSCFTLQQPSLPEPIQLEYTTLGAQQGVLMLWSYGAITAPITLTLVDHCQQSSQTFTIQADNSVSMVTPLLAPKVTPVTASSNTNAIANPDSVLVNAVAEPLSVTPEISVDAYNTLQQQIDSLQTDFQQLQKKSDTLYASTLVQANILADLKNQLTQLQNENHLLRTLVLTLGLGLLVSGYFLRIGCVAMQQCRKRPKHVRLP